MGTGQKGDEKVVEYGAIPYEISHPGDDCGVDRGPQVVCEGQAGRVAARPRPGPLV